jgi:hypothetical protein
MEFTSYSDKSSYTFPFNTCEKPNKTGISQPYSVFFNLVSCVIVIYFLSITKNNSSKLLLFSILLFELFHTFSHSIHLNNNSQIIITHLLAYFVNFCYLYALYIYSNIFPNKIFLFYLLLLILFDLYAFQKLPFIFYLSSQFLIFISLFLYYYKYFSKEIKKKIPLIFILTLLILLLFINESYNCKKMLDEYNWFPFHILIEITAIFIVYNVSNIFSKL